MSVNIKLRKYEKAVHIRTDIIDSHHCQLRLKQEKPQRKERIDDAGDYPAWKE